MKGSIDESRITAFALGDLDGEERAEVERALVADAELAARVEAIRAAAASIERGFQAEPLPEPPMSARRAPHWGLWLTGTVAAACAVLAMTWPTVDRFTRPSDVRTEGSADGNLRDLGRHVTLYVSKYPELDGLILTAPEYYDEAIRLRDDQKGSLLTAMNKAKTDQSEAERTALAWQDKYGSLEGELTKLRGQYETIGAVISERDQVIAQLTQQLDASPDQALVDTTIVTTTFSGFHDPSLKLKFPPHTSKETYLRLEIDQLFEAFRGEEWSEAPLCEQFWAGGSGTLQSLTFRELAVADHDDAGDDNEDFVSYQDNGDLQIAENPLYGLDVDSNYWKIETESAWKDASGYAAAQVQVVEAWRGLLARHRDLKDVREALKAVRALGGDPDGLPPGVQGPDVPHNTEQYPPIVENPFLEALENPLSTFSIDVDTASYANVRRFLTGDQLPPPDAVRLEELINYFTYDYAPPTDDRPFAVHMEMASCPWRPEHKLLRVGLKGRTLDKRPPSNLVFLLDVSGSMNQPNKLPLVKAALGLLVDQLTETDRVSIVVYAGATGLVLPPTTGDKKARLREALERLEAGGSTNGGAGIELAYALATQNFVQGGTNRVVLATDGDWNVGTTNQGDLTRLIEEKAKTGVFLSVLGFGMGNLKDGTLEMLADKGNGNYAYVDTLAEARKVLVEQMAGTLCTIAKDVKIQIEFNPARIAGYRLIGYENRVLAKEDFNDDKKDAGEIGAGHTVTALYELVPADQEVPGGRPPVDPLKYQTPTEPAGGSLDLCTVKLRYKAPEGSESALMETPFKQGRESFDDASADFRFAAAVAGYGMLLRHSAHAEALTWDAVLEIASGALGEDREEYRAEFLGLVKKAKELSAK